MIRRVAILTGGGDCPGLNAVIRTVTRISIQHHHWNVVGIHDGFAGLIEQRYSPLGPGDVRGILRRGGTILGASNRANPFAWKPGQEDQPVDASNRAIHTLEMIGADALIIVGGDGTLSIANRLAGLGVPIVAIPKTIDNDVHGTDIAIGFDTCVGTVVDALDKIHTTAESHHRVLLVEVMGRTAGWVALYAGVAGGADAILIPERGYQIEQLEKVIDERIQSGRNFTVAVVAEGVTGPAGYPSFISTRGVEYDWKLGGVCQALAASLIGVTAQEVRTIVLGHLQRGGSPSVADRNLATRLAWRAIEAVAHGDFSVMAADAGGDTTLVPLAEVAAGSRPVPPHHPLLSAADQMGIYVG